MAFQAGTGGSVLTGTGTPLELSIGKWTLDESIALASTTHSKNSGHKHRTPTVKDDAWTFEMPWDDTNATPSAMGIALGAEITLKFEKGGGSKYLTSSTCVVEKIGWVCDNDEDVVRLAVSGYSNSVFTHG